MLVLCASLWRLLWGVMANNNVQLVLSHWPGKGLSARYYARNIMKMAPEEGQAAMQRVPEQLQPLVKKHIELSGQRS